MASTAPSDPNSYLSSLESWVAKAAEASKPKDQLDKDECAEQINTVLQSVLMNKDQLGEAQRLKLRYLCLLLKASDAKGLIRADLISSVDELKSKILMPSDQTEIVIHTKDGDVNILRESIKGQSEFFDRMLERGQTLNLGDVSKDLILKFVECLAKPSLDSSHLSPEETLALLEFSGKYLLDKFKAKLMRPLLQHQLMRPLLQNLGCAFQEKQIGSPPNTVTKYIIAAGEIGVLTDDIWRNVGQDLPVYVGVHGPGELNEVLQARQTLDIKLPLQLKYDGLSMAEEEKLKADAAVQGIRIEPYLERGEAAALALQNLGCAFQEKQIGSPPNTVTKYIIAAGEIGVLTDDIWRNVGQDHPVYVGVHGPNELKKVLQECQTLDIKLPLQLKYEGLSMAEEVKLKADAAAKGIRIEPYLEREEAVALAFGAEQWKEILGVTIHDAPEIPGYFVEDLNRACPWTPGKTKAETHELFLVSNVDNHGNPLNFQALNELMSPHMPHLPEEPNNPGFRLVSDLVKELMQAKEAKPIEGPYWVLMPTSVFGKSRNPLFVVVDKKAMSALEHFPVPEKDHPYEIPNTREATILNLVVFLKTRDFAFGGGYGDNLYHTFTTDELIGHRHVCIGGGMSAAWQGLPQPGLCATLEDEINPYDYVGLAPRRRS